MKVLNRLIAIIVGAGVISLIGLKVYYQVDMDYVYISNLPGWISWGNIAIIYAVAALKVITVLLLMFGGKKASRVALLPLTLVVGEYIFHYRAEFYTAYVEFINPNFIDVARNYGLGQLLYLIAMIVVPIFYLFYLLFAVFGITHRLFIRILLFIFGAAPIIIAYVVEYLLTGSFMPRYHNLVVFGSLYGLYFIIGFAVLITHFNPNKQKRIKKAKVSIDNPILPLNKLIK